MLPTNIFHWEGIDGIFVPRDTSTPIPQTPTSKESPISSPSRLTSPSSEDSDYSFVPSTPPDSTVSLDSVWESVRKVKERSMALSPGKIKSLEAHSPAVISPQKLDFTKTNSNKYTRLKSGKSYVKYRESLDGKTVTAIFDLPRVSKEDMHVSFQGTRLVVSWRTMKITEREEPLLNDTGTTRTLRELEHKKYSRTIPLPDGTHFEDIRAARDGTHLVVTYPNIQTFNFEGP